MLQEKAFAHEIAENGLQLLNLFKARGLEILLSPVSGIGRPPHTAFGYIKDVRDECERITGYGFFCLPVFEDGEIPIELL